MDAMVLAGVLMLVGGVGLGMAVAALLLPARVITVGTKTVVMPENATPEEVARFRRLWEQVVVPPVSNEAPTPRPVG